MQHTVWLSLLTPNGAAVPEADSPGEMFGSEGEALPAHVFRPQLGQLKRFRAFILVGEKCLENGAEKKLVQRKMCLTYMYS